MGECKKTACKKEKAIIYKIQIRKQALKEIEQLPTKTIKQINEAIDGLAKEPRPHGCKKLKGDKEYLWRIRVGDYRILYMIDDVVKVIDIRKVGNRKDIYE